MTQMYAHIGALFQAKREEKGLTLRTVANAAGIPITSWEKFEQTGSGTTVNRIASVVDIIRLQKEELTSLENPLSSLPLLWGAGLGNVLRQARGSRHTRVIAEESGVSINTINRWETATSRPRYVPPLAAVLQVLNQNPISLLEQALWPPEDPMIERSNFAKYVVSWCAENSVSQTKLARLLEVNGATMSSWLRGRNRPRTDIRPRIANFFGITEKKLDSMIQPIKVDTYGMSDWQKELVKTRLKSHINKNDKSFKGLGSVTNYETGKVTPKTARTLSIYSNLIGADTNKIVTERLGIVAEEASFADLLFLSRTTTGLTIRQAAALVGVNHTIWSYWENNQVLPGVADRKYNVAAIAKHLKVRPALIWHAINRSVLSVDPFTSWLIKAMEKVDVQTYSELDKEMGLASGAFAWVNSLSRPGVRLAPKLAEALEVSEEEVLQQLKIPRRVKRK